MRKNAPFPKKATSRFLDEAETVSREIADSGAAVGNAFSQWIGRKPLQSVLLALGAGLLLGRIRVRPVETIVLAAVAGLGCGFALARAQQPKEPG